MKETNVAELFKNLITNESVRQNSISNIESILACLDKESLKIKQKICTLMMHLYMNLNVVVKLNSNGYNIVLSTATVIITFKKGSVSIKSVDEYTLNEILPIIKDIYDVLIEEELEKDYPKYW